MQIGKIAGISLRVHPTFLVVMALYCVLGLAAQALLVFALVIGHELAHLLTAKAYGFKIIGLELFPFGGAAYSDDIFEGRKMEESVTALAGPVFNIVLLFCAEALRWQGWWQGTLAEDFVRFNFWLAAFNLLPVLPLDGGRVVRALLSDALGYVKTTKGLAWAGKITGILFVLIGISSWAGALNWQGGMALLTLGIFFWLAGSKEVSTAHVTFLRQMTRKKEELVRKGLMRSKWLTVYKDTPLVRIVEQLTPDRYALVTLSSENFGIKKTFTETEVLEGMLREGIYYPIGKLNAE